VNAGASANAVICGSCPNDVHDASASGFAPAVAAKISTAVAAATGERARRRRTAEDGTQCS
jgi:hypothetical protein